VQVELFLSGTYYPFGFRLDIATNSPEVLAAAEASWGGGGEEFPGATLRMSVVVAPEGGLAQTGTHRKVGHLYSAICDPDNFALVDTERQVAAVHVSQETASDQGRLRWFFVEAIPHMMLCQRQVVMIHAGLVASDGGAVMLCGRSMSGKSTLAYACARAGWTFLSDDCTTLLADSTDRIAMGLPREIRFRADAAQLFPELEGCVARARPTGKLAIEIPTTALDIETGDRAPIRGIAFLERRSGAASARCITGDEAVDRLFAEMATYGPEVDAIHARAVERLAAVPAHILRYDTPDDGVRLLSSL